MSQSTSISASDKQARLSNSYWFPTDLRPASPLPDAPFETTGSDGDYAPSSFEPSGETLHTGSSSSHGPSHYRRGKIEVWDFIRDQDLNYHLGCAIKYICRAGFKGSASPDLAKAIHYLQNELESRIKQ